MADIMLAIACRNNDEESLNKSLKSQLITSFINNNVPAKNIPGLYRYHSHDLEFTTAFVLASRHCSLSLVQKLVSAGADITSTNGYGNTPLHSVCYSEIDTLGKAEFLLSLNESALFATNIFNNTPLYYATLTGHNDVTELFVNSGADVNTKGEYGRTALHSAAAGCHVKCIEILLKHKADICINDDFGFTPLHMASAAGNTDGTALLMSANAINARTKIGRTPLHLAAANGHLNVVQYLTSFPACYIKVIDHAGKTAAQYAREQGHHQIVAFLKHVEFTRSLHDDISDLRRTQEAILQVLKGVPAAQAEKQLISEQSKALAEAVRYHMKTLVADISAVDHLDFLYSRRALTADEYEKLRSTTGRTEQCRKMLLTLTAKRDPSWAAIFIESLEKEPTTWHAAVRIRSTDVTTLLTEDIQ